MSAAAQEDMELSQRLTSDASPVDDVRTRVPARDPSQRTCWQDFTASLSNFCGLVDEEQEESFKWQARLEDLKKDRLIGHGEVAQDETDGPCIRPSPRIPISLTTTSKRCRRSQMTEGKQSGIMSTAVDGIKDLLDSKPKKSKRKPQLRSRSFTPAAIREFGKSPIYRDYDETDQDKGYSHDDVQLRVPGILNDSFFADAVGTSSLYRRKRQSQYDNAQYNAYEAYGDNDEVDGRYAQKQWEESGNWMIRSRRSHGEARRIEPESLGFEAGFEDEVDFRDRRADTELRRRDPAQSRINKLGFNSNREKVNQGWFARLLDQGILARLFEFKLFDSARTHKHRPLFSYWMTFVQVVIFIVSLSVYGVAPVGFDESIVSKEIIQPNLALKLESYREKENFWVGPRQADLIKLGAKFSPCMRRDQNVHTAIMNDRIEENRTACCTYNDGSGCVQTKQDECSDTLATWRKWSAKKPGMPDKRVSGSVCGQDPRYCRSPASSGAFLWPDDITKWPLCQDTIKTESKLEEDRHASCEVVGRPCCMGIQGECVITTREHCKFYRGHFHEEASLCSQVNCMKDICGMLPFGNPQIPDQFYRLWTCLFLHAGLIHVVITILFNLFIMMSIEQTVGWIRVIVIYMGSGVCGSLASAIFVPYHVEAGASGSQFGLLATQLVLVILYTEKPWQATWKILVLILVLLIIGLLPMVDNYAHIFGFVFGFLISFAMLPFARFKSSSMAPRTQRIVAIAVCSILAIGLAAILIVFFYVAPVYNCPGCQYFNCIPFTPTFCETMEVKIRGVSMV